MATNNTASILQYLGFQPFSDFNVYDVDGNITIEWLSTAAQPTQAQIDAAAKPWAASVKTEEIYREQEIRSKTVYGEEVSRYFFNWIEELYSQILVQSARNNITATNTPITYGLKVLRDARNQLLAALDGAIACANITYDQILAFDVTQPATTLHFCGTDYSWDGWGYPRPS